MYITLYLCIFSCCTISVSRVELFFKKGDCLVNFYLLGFIIVLFNQMSLCVDFLYRNKMYNDFFLYYCTF